MKKIILTLSLALIATIGFAQNIYPEMVDGKACLVKQNGKKVKVLVNENFEKYGDYNESAGLIPAKLNGKWGFYDNDGKLIIPHIYESILASCSGSNCTGWYVQNQIKAWVKKEDKPIFIDKTGKEVSAPEYDLVIETTHTGAGYFFKKDGKWALADKDKKVLTEFKYDVIRGPITVNPFAYKATRDGQDYRLGANGQEEAVMESSSNTNSSANKKEEKTKCNYKCKECSKITQGNCNSSNTGITIENCPVRQPDPKGPKKGHEWVKQ
jgi:hypothetical protein